MNRKKVRKEPSRDKRRFYISFDRIIGPAVILDKKGTLLKVSKAIEQITGLERKEFVGKKFYDLGLLTKESERLIEENLAKRMAGEKIEPYEIKGHAKDGRRLIFEVNATLLEYEGEPVDFVMFRDITEHKQVENRIKLEREVYRSISRAANRSRTVEELCELALKGIQRAIEYDMADVMVYRESENALLSVAQVGYPEDLYRRTIKRQDLKEESRVAAQAVRKRKSIYIDDIKTSKLTSYAQDLIVKYDISTLYVVPLFSRGKLQGVLEVLTVGRKRLSREDREVLDTISEELAGGIAKAKIEEQLVTVKEAFGWLSV